MGAKTRDRAYHSDQAPRRANSLFGSIVPIIAHDTLWRKPSTINPLYRRGLDFPGVDQASTIVHWMRFPTLAA